MDILGTLQKMGITIIMVTHAPDLANYSDRCVYIKDGRIENISNNKKEQTHSLSPPGSKRQSASLNMTENCSNT